MAYTNTWITFTNKWISKKACSFQSNHEIDNILLGEINGEESLNISTSILVNDCEASGVNNLNSDVDVEVRIKRCMKETKTMKMQMKAKIM